MKPSSYSEYMEITPKLAQEWLGKNTSNRKLRPMFVKQLAEKIKCGEWCDDLPDHIAFYEDGTLANGQHRLSAIVLAGQSVYTTVDFNIRKSSAICIDTGKARSFGDNIHILTGETFYTKKVSNMMRESFVGGRKLTHEDHLRLAKRYKDDIQFIVACFKYSPRHIQQTHVLAACFTALQAGVSRQDIQDFAHVLVSGRAVEERDTVVIKLRDKLVQDAYGSAGGGVNFGANMRRAQNCIHYFVNNSDVIQLKAIDTYRYPLLRIEGMFPDR